MIKYPSNNFWINLTGFQLAWWCAILLGNHGVMILSVLLVFHFVYHQTPKAEMAFVFSAGILGYLLDTLLTLQGVFVFSESGLPPVWLLLLWFCFSATLRQSLSFFQSRLWLAGSMGGVSGALTYLAAARLGAFAPGISEMSLFILLVLLWSGLFPLLMWLSALPKLKEASDAY